MVVALALIGAGALLLTAGAEAFAEHVVAAARVVRLSAFGLALLLAGAEPEEAWTAAVASYRGRPDLAAGDAVGANLVVSTITLGLLAIVVPFVVTRTVRRYAAVAGVAGLVAVAVVFDGTVPRWEGAVLLALYVAAVALLWRHERIPPPIGEAAELGEHRDDPPSPGALAWLAAGLVAMVAGGVVAVDGAQRFVAASGLSDSAVGLTLLALATSFEMLALVWSAQRRGLGEVALAGALGAVAYNATVTLGVAALVHPLHLAATTELVAVAVVVVVALSLVVASYGRRLGRLVGGGLVAGYLVTVSLLLR